MPADATVNRPAMDRESVQRQLYGSVRFGTLYTFGSLLTPKESPLDYCSPITKPFINRYNGVPGVGAVQLSLSLPLWASNVHLSHAERWYTDVALHVHHVTDMCGSVRSTYGYWRVPEGYQPTRYPDMPRLILTMVNVSPACVNY